MNSIIPREAVGVLEGLTNFPTRRHMTSTNTRLSFLLCRRMRNHFPAAIFIFQNRPTFSFCFFTDFVGHENLLWLISTSMTYFKISRQGLIRSPLKRANLKGFNLNPGAFDLHSKNDKL